MKVYVFEWLSTLVRWTHVVAGIAWLGASFYFQALDKRLRHRATTPEEATADVWEVHGFGFFHVTKYLTPPTSLPPVEDLVWHRWQANVTWLSGFTLFTLTYYLRAQLFLIDPTVLNISAGLAVTISIAGLLIAWLGYDGLCRSSLSRNAALLGFACYGLFLLLAYGYSRVFSARGAFMQLGAMIGTIMLANVYFFIIPSLRKIVADIPLRQPPAPDVLKQFARRSLHNNYLSLAVVFVMIGNHFPLAFATRYSWLIVALIVPMSAFIRYFFLDMHRSGRKLLWPWAMAALLFLSVVAISMAGSRPAQNVAEAPSISPIVTASDIRPIILGRCSVCHSTTPGWPNIGVPPKGVTLQTVEDIENHAYDINREAILTEAMPPAHAMGFSESERDLVAQWLRTGAHPE